MKPLNLVVAQSNPKNAEILALNLQSHFKGVSLVRDLEELRKAILQNRADVAVIDLEMAPLIEVDKLRQEFSKLEIVCTHRLADESMWSAALRVGAADCCHPSDVRGIVLAANRTKIMARTSAA
jgi:DNA-binding NarL/FixJ family response regulator